MSLQGEGAGPGPTSSSLLSDLLSILRGNIKYPFGLSSKKENLLNHLIMIIILILYILDLKLMINRVFFLLITNRLAKYKISVKRIIQTPDKKNKRATIVIITHKTSEKNASNCLSIFRKNKNILRSPTLIRLYN